ncbi:hypothetical protein FTO70_04425 [Methanosarcina sp. KYL-1]|uniref:ferredoxin domain-containing protein n=1 Tax=Methanosarcina sp. KYL-1 TaxID=2602068 RepID=UPI0021011630|nr:DUF2148 domain-containing protein [Methanosarcina sp. KYL-1]MCQ1534945.1 hypothetical protein [Methanosarcina sp. KYL-1]
MILNPESEVLETLAKSILLAARTAPKAKGVDDIVTALVEKEDIEVLASTMEKLASRKGEGFSFLKRDAGNLRNAGAAVLIGVKASGAAGLNCGACGFATCKEMLAQQKIEEEFRGPNCMLKYADLGIAVGSAVARAKDLCIDNRVMYTLGAAARVSGLLDADVAFGIPLSVKGKNIFFDRK